MFEQDYIMRLVCGIARVFAKILFNINSETVSEELESHIEETDILEKLLEMVDIGKINEAENDYSREEVKEGMEDIAERVGLSGLINTLFIE